MSTGKCLQTITHQFEDSTKSKTPWLGVRERTIPTERPPLVSEVVRTFADRGAQKVNKTFFVLYRVSRTY
jgi:hypothetical protein